MAYEDSDYTFMIAIMHCPNRTILVLKLTLVVEIGALLSRRGRHCSSALSDFRWQYREPFLGKAREVSAVHWRLHAKTHRAGEVVSAV